MRRVISVGDKDRAVRLLGPQDSYLKRLREAFGVKVVARGGEVSIEGPSAQVRGAEKVLGYIEERLEAQKPTTLGLVEQLISQAKFELSCGSSREVARLRIEGFRPGKATLPKTQGQVRYVEAIYHNDIVFCIGPAGSGKTYLAVAVAVQCLKRQQVNKIILCRPAVEAGERLGFLPGDMHAKVNPYLRPLYDALREMMEVGKLQRYVENDLIEILPLAFIRGRTLDEAFIIFDEAQNSTVRQMKTFLTRLGVSAKLVVTGDITQIDLPAEEESGLVDVQGRVKGISGVAFVALGEADIVRHRLVREIVDAYRKESGPLQDERPEQERPADARQ